MILRSIATTIVTRVNPYPQLRCFTRPQDFTSLHIPRPSMAEIPVLIIHKLKIRKRKLLLDESSQFILYRLCPVAYKYDELINVPSHSSTGYLRIIAFELGLFMFCLGTEIFFRPYLTMKMGIINEWESFLRRIFNHLRS